MTTGLRRKEVLTPWMLWRHAGSSATWCHTVETSHLLILATRKTAIGGTAVAVAVAVAVARVRWTEFGPLLGAERVADKPIMVASWFGPAGGGVSQVASGRCRVA